eukprot:7504021-Pyramimonas_sp.AAC.1
MPTRGGVCGTTVVGAVQCLEPCVVHRGEECAVPPAAYDPTAAIDPTGSVSRQFSDPTIGSVLPHSHRPISESS